MATKQAPKEEKRPSHVPSEDVTLPKGDDAFPSINIIQDLSPEKEKGGEKYIQGAQPGMMFNSATRALFDGEKGVFVVPLLVTRQWLEWVPRKAGGGLVASYDDAESAKNNAQPGNEVRLSISYFCRLADGTVAAVRLGTASKMKVHRKWANLVKMNKTVYGRSYHLFVVREKNRQGQPYFNFDVASGPWVNKKVFAEAEAQVRAVTEQQQSRQMQLTGPAEKEEF